MFNRIASRCIHLFLFFMSAATCGTIVAGILLRKSNADGFSWTPLDYYLVVVGAITTLQSLAWIFQSRLYESGRPAVQEILFSGIFAGLFLAAAAWQFYNAYANGGAGYICPWDSYDTMVICRLWQAEVAACAFLGVVHIVVTILWIHLFRRRIQILKDMPQELHYPRSNVPVLGKDVGWTENDERDKQAALAGVPTLDRRTPTPTSGPPNNSPWPQQQMQQPLRQPTLGTNHNTPNSILPPPSQRMIQPQPSTYSMRHQPTPPPHQQQMQQQQPYPLDHQPQHQGTMPVNNQYIYQGNQEQAAHPQSDYYNSQYISPNGNGYSRYTESPAANGYTQGYFEGQLSEMPTGYTPGQTFDDPNSQEAMAHLAYANQLREQQLYHEQMAEVLQMQKSQQQQTRGMTTTSSGSTTMYPIPPPVMGSGSTNVLTTAHLTAPASQGPSNSSGFGGSGLSKGTIGTARLANPQQYPDFN